MQSNMTVIEAFRRLLGVVTPDIDNLIERLSAGNVKGHEIPLLEFKASYVPLSEDPDSLDACRWNVIKAIVGMANSQGGGVILGLAEDPKTKELRRGNADPDNILSQPGKEDKDLVAHTVSKLFSGKEFHLFDSKGNPEAIKLEDDFWERIKCQTDGSNGFVVCKSHIGGEEFPVVIIFVNPLPAGEELLFVEHEKEKDGKITHEVVYYVRSETESETLPHVFQERITSKTTIIPCGKQTIIDNRPNEDKNKNRRLRKEYNAFVRRRDPTRVLSALMKLHGDPTFPNNQNQLPTGVLYGNDHHERDVCGRDKETDAVLEALRDSGIVVVHGGGGNGKTTLVEHVATEWLKSDGGYAFWIKAERIQNWLSVFESLLALDHRIRDVLPQNEEQSANKAVSPPKDIPPEKRISKWLLNKAGEGTPVLLILDNVEDPNLFADKALQCWFEERIPNRVYILATSRIQIARQNVDNPIRQIPLGYLDPIAARQLLITVARERNWNEETLSKEELKALNDLVALTQGHAWSIIQIGRFMGDVEDPQGGLSVPMSFRSAFDIYREQGISAFSPDDPQYCKKLLAPTLDYIRRLKKGDMLFDLARVAALVARDGIAEKHLLRAFWKRISGEFDSLFDTAIKRLVGCSLFDSACEKTIEMHRNTQAVLQGENNDDFYSLVGLFLAEYPGFDLHRWPDLMDLGMPSEYVPVHLMDVETLRSVLSKDWNLLRPDIVSEFDAEDICWVIENGPHEALSFPWNWSRLEKRKTRQDFVSPKNKYLHLPGGWRIPFDAQDIPFPESLRGPFLPIYWTDVLEKHPELIRHCDLSKLSHDDLWVVTKANPKLVDEVPFFKEIAKGLPHYLIAHPEFASEERLARLDPEGWSFLCRVDSSYQERMPSSIRDLVERIRTEEGFVKERRHLAESDWDDVLNQEDQDSEIIREQEAWEDQMRELEERERDLEEFYGVSVLSEEGFLSSENGREMAVYLMIHPEEIDSRSLDPMRPDDWLILFAELPELMSSLGTGKVMGASSRGWREAFIRASSSEWIKECASTFVLSGGWDMFTGLDWGLLVDCHPELSDKCPWHMMSPKEYAQVLVSHPDWSKKYDLSFSELDDEQWIELLGNHPEYHAKCRRRFSKTSAGKLASLIERHPQLLDTLSGNNQPSLFDPCLLFCRTGNSRLPWMSLLCPSYRPNTSVDFYSEWTQRGLPIRWDSLNAFEWSELIQKHPECGEEFRKRKAWSCFTGNDWRELLAVQPEHYGVCDWSKLSPDDWIRLLAKQRQFASMIPEDISTKDLLTIFEKCPWIDKQLPSGHPAKKSYARVANTFENNLRTLRLSQADFVWPHPALVLFCENLDDRYDREESVLKTLAEGLGTYYVPQDPKTLRDLSERLFENKELYEVDVCRFERRILFSQIEHGDWDGALSLINHLAEFVKRATETDEKLSDLSLAVSDAFAFFCKGEVLWAKELYTEAAAALRDAKSCKPFQFELRFSQDKLPSYVTDKAWCDHVKKCLNGLPDFRNYRMDHQIDVAISDCDAQIPKHLGTTFWFNKISWLVSANNPNNSPFQFAGVSLKYGSSVEALGRWIDF